MKLFDPILCWIGSFLGWLDRITGSYMIAIFIFAVIIEVIMLFAFGIRQQKNSIKQASLRPKEQAIRKKYAGRDDKATQQKVTQEIQEMYQQEGYNPLGGCLPLLLQFPVIIALYYVVINPLHYVIGISQDFITAMTTYVTAAADKGGLGLSLNAGRGTIELISLIKEKGIEFFSGIVSYTNADLNVSMKDTYDAFAAAYEKGLPNFNFFGLNLGEVPGDAGFGWLWLIPLLTFLVYFASMRLGHKFSYQPSTGSAETDRQTACSNWMMDIMMPLFSVWIAFTVPAAIGVYWIFKSILGTLKQFIMSKVMPLPTFTEEDYRAAEKEYSGKTAKEKPKKLDLDAAKRNPKSLFYMDDEDYVAPEVEEEIGRKLTESDGSGENDKAAISRAPMKDESDKEKK